MNDRQSLPWSLSDLRTSFLTTAVAAALLAWAWWDASGTGELDEQTTSMVLGIFATVVLAAGAFSWVWSGRRAVRMRRLDLLAKMESTFVVAVDGNGRSEATGFVTLPGSVRYHRATCALVRGKDVRRAEAGGLRPCEMCEPGS